MNSETLYACDLCGARYASNFLRDNKEELKHDKDKLKMELIPAETLESLAEVLTYGAKKYKKDGWKEVQKERYIGALLRHLVKYMKDEVSVDPESKLLHIQHILANAAFLDYLSNRGDRSFEI